MKTKFQQLLSMASNKQAHFNCEEVWFKCKNWVSASENKSWKANNKSTGLGLSKMLQNYKKAP